MSTLSTYLFLLVSAAGVIPPAVVSAAEPRRPQPTRPQVGFRAEGSSGQRRLGLRTPDRTRRITKVAGRGRVAARSQRSQQRAEVQPFWFSPENPTGAHGGGNAGFNNRKARAFLDLPPGASVVLAESSGRSGSINNV